MSRQHCVVLVCCWSVDFETTHSTHSTHTHTHTARIDSIGDMSEEQSLLINEGSHQSPYPSPRTTRAKRKELRDRAAGQDDDDDKLLGSDEHAQPVTLEPARYYVLFMYFMLTNNQYVS